VSRRAPRPLSLAIGDLSRELEPATVLAECQRVWPDVTGPAISAEARPVSERAGVLTIACRSSVWASELDLMGPTLVARLNEALGHSAVQRLRCVTGGVGGAT
jgi:predicted nucleic acid-binding Zn ribbon protein